MNFQRAILALHGRGVILALASKNNPADVDEVFRNHPFMQLKREHFSALQIHWGPKSGSIEAIARELNIGTEHIVLADDNPAECMEVARALPMVEVIQLPSRPELFVNVLQESGLFDVLAISKEDARRAELYRQRAGAETLRGKTGSLEHYYRDLAMELIISPVEASTLARTAQLTQKTNQLNVTTRRYSETEITRRMIDPRWALFTVTVRDRFGDNGIVGVMMAECVDNALDIDTFLLSCRIIGRTVETAMLARLCVEARVRNLQRLTGMLIPTPKNLPVRDLFVRHGFAQRNSQGVADDMPSTWTLNVSAQPVLYPTWFKLVLEPAVVEA